MAHKTLNYVNYYIRIAGMGKELLRGWECRSKMATGAAVATILESRALLVRVGEFGVGSDT